MTTTTKIRSKPDTALRDKILQAAMDIMQRQGVKKLSQAKVAQAIGIRQSHLTYYFPKKIDLVKGLLQQHIDSTAEKLSAIESPEDAPDMHSAMEMLTSDPSRMRFFIGLIIEADDSDELRQMIDAHIRQVNALVAHYYGRDPEDSQVEAFMNALRGRGLANMLRPEGTPPANIADLAQRFGLQR